LFEQANIKEYANKTILNTGATDGIGKQTAVELLKSGHHIIQHGRLHDSAEQAAKKKCRIKCKFFVKLHRFVRLSSNMLFAIFALADEILILQINFLIS
jgi:NAD(P)-dependent dehydrogenase (short-subunit alcohol dehydrogenase family)